MKFNRDDVCALLGHHAALSDFWNLMAHAQKPDFVFRRNGRVYLNRRGRQFSRPLVAEVCASKVVMLDTPCSEVVWRVLATHSNRQFPLHFPSRASQNAITFQLDSKSLPTFQDKIHAPSSKVNKLYFLTIEYGADWLSRNVGKDLPLHGVISQKSAGLICIATEARNHAYEILPHANNSIKKQVVSNLLV